MTRRTKAVTATCWKVKEPCIGTKSQALGSNYGTTIVLGLHYVCVHQSPCGIFGALKQAHTHLLRSAGTHPCRFCSGWWMHIPCISMQGPNYCHVQGRLLQTHRQLPQEVLPQMTSLVWGLLIEAARVPIAVPSCSCWHWSLPCLVALWQTGLPSRLPALHKVLRPACFCAVWCACCRV